MPYCGFASINYNCYFLSVAIESAERNEQKNQFHPNSHNSSLIIFLSAALLISSPAGSDVIQNRVDTDPAFNCVHLSKCIWLTGDSEANNQKPNRHLHYERVDFFSVWNLLLMSVRLH